MIIILVLNKLYKNVLPIRIQEFHILNEHPVAKLVEKIIWPFLSSKIRNRV